MEEARNLAQLAEQSMQGRGDRHAMLFDGEFVSHATILARAKRLQGALTEFGLRRDKVVAMCMTNHPLVYSVFGGIFRTGGIAVPVLTQLSPSELRYIFDHTEAIGIVTDSEVLDKVREAVAGLAHIKWIAVRGGTTDASRATPEYDLDEFLAFEEQTQLPEISESDVALMLYTSGTTGRPKGVMLTHSNLMMSGDAVLEANEYDLRPHPIIGLTSLPMAHIFGVGVMKSQYLFPDEFEPGYVVQEKWFDPEKFLRKIEEEKVTDLYVVPTMLALMASHPKFNEYDLSTINMVHVGAAPLPLEVADAFIERTGCFVKQLYGMTENSGQGTAGRISKGYRPGAAGLPYITTELRIVDDNDQPVPTGTRGEIVTRGPATMKGYFKDSEATSVATRNGWMHTGDIGYLDEDGFLFVVDRKKDMIIKGGENIFPAEVENVLYTHPDVAEAAVVGVPDKVYGEEIVAFVVTQSGSDANAEELIGHVKSQLSSFKAPVAVHFLEQLPKSGVGKILRRELRDRHSVS